MEILTSKQLRTTIWLHVWLAVIWVGAVHFLDPATNAPFWPLATLVFVVAFHLLHGHTLTAAVSYAYAERRTDQHRIAVQALIASYLSLLVITAALSTLLGTRGAPYEFLYKSMSYSVYLPFPLITAIAHVVRALTMRIGPGVAISSSPFLATLPYLLSYVLLLASAGTYFVLHYNDPYFQSTCIIDGTCTGGMDPDKLEPFERACGSLLRLARDETAPYEPYEKPCLTRAHELRSEQALKIASVWNTVITISSLMVFVAVYWKFAKWQPYRRRPETVLFVITFPLATIWLVCSFSSVLVTSGYWLVIGPWPEPRALFGQLDLTLDAALIGWLASIPLTLVAAPMLMTTFNDPVKMRADNEEAQRHQARNQRRRRTTVHAAANFWSRAVRAQMIAAAIWNRNVTALVLALPVSLFGTVRALASARSDNNVETLLIGATVGGSLLWLGVLINGLYFFVDTAAATFESLLVRYIGRLNNHTVLIGYDELSRALLPEWLERGLIGYTDVHDRIMYSPNIVLPDGGLGRLLVRGLVIDEPLPSGVGLVPLQRNVRGSVVSVTMTARQMLTKTHQAQRKVLQERHKWLRPLLRWSMDFDRYLNRLTEYYVPLIAGDASSKEVRDVACIRRARIVVSTSWTRETATTGFATLEAIEQQRESGFVTPMLALTSSSAFRPHIMTRASLELAPVHVVQVDRLQAAEAGLMLWAAFKKSCIAKKSASLLVVADGKRLSQLLDVFLSQSSASERSSFGSEDLVGVNRLVVLSNDPDLQVLPAPVLKEGNPWLEVTEKLKAQGVKHRVVCYRPYVARYWPQGEAKGQISAGVAQGLWILHVDSDSRDHQTACVVDELCGPDVILVSEPQIGDALRRLNSLGTAVSRRQTRRQLQVLVTADRSAPRLTRLYLNAINYGAVLSSPEVVSDALYPTHRSGYVDSLKSAVEHTTGLVAAYHRAEINRQRKVVELNICAVNGAGGIGSTLAKLCGAVVDATSPLASSSIRIGLIDMRLDVINTDRFELVAFCRLTEGKSYTPDDWPGCRLSVNAPSEGRPTTIYEETMAVLGVSRIPGPSILEQSEVARASCCGMATCAIEATQKLVETAAAAAQPTHLTRLSEGYWAAPGDSAVWANPPGASDTLNDHVARVTLKCRGAELRGTFAVAVGAMLGWRLKAKYGSSKVVHLTHVSATKCHDHRFGLYTAVGFGAEDFRSIPSAAEVIEEVIMQPVCGRDAWMAYAERLNEFLPDAVVKVD